MKNWIEITQDTKPTSDIYAFIWLYPINKPFVAKYHVDDDNWENIGDIPLYETYETLVSTATHYIPLTEDADLESPDFGDYFERHQENKAGGK